MQYGMFDQTLLDSAGMPLTVRAVFIIGPDKKIKLIIIYPASTGQLLSFCVSICVCVCAERCFRPQLR